MALFSTLDRPLRSTEYMKDRNVPVSVVNNEAEGEEHLKTLVDELFEDLFK